MTTCGPDCVETPGPLRVGRPCLNAMYNATTIAPMVIALIVSFMLLHRYRYADVAPDADAASTAVCASAR